MRSGAAHQSQSVPYRSGVAWNGCWWGISTNAAMTERVTLHLSDMAAAHRVRQALEVMEVDVAPPSDRGTPASSPGVRCGPLSSSSTASDSVLGVIVAATTAPSVGEAGQRTCSREARTVLRLRKASVSYETPLRAVLARCRATT